MSHVCVKMHQALELRMSLEVDLFLNDCDFDRIHRC